MKKTFLLTNPKLNADRVVDSVKHDIKKYFKRERKKSLPDDVDFWDFDCKFGNIEAEAVDVVPAQINKLIDEAVKQSLESVYVEIHAKPGYRVKKEAFDDE